MHVATESTDLTEELKRGLSFVRYEHPSSLPRKTKFLKVTIFLTHGHSL